MWDSEQLSQAAASCSQGSQNSSSDLFSQSRMSQLKGFSSFDVSSQQPTNSQQMPEVFCNFAAELRSFPRYKIEHKIFVKLSQVVI